jgi:hypothetical protein
MVKSGYVIKDLKCCRSRRRKRRRRKTFYDIYDNHYWNTLAESYSR